MRVNQRSPKRANHCRRFMVSAIIEDVIEHLYSLSEGSQKRWIPFAQNSCNAESEGFGTDLNLSQ